MKNWFLFLMLFVYPAYSFTPEKNDTKPNILFIEVDDLEYEYLSYTGNSVVSTPNVDKLAEEGVYFRNAVCQGMMCGPSRNALITGLYPHNLGFYQNGQMHALPEDIWTFPKAMQRSGYYTAWIGKCHVRPFIRKGQDKNEAMREQMGFNFVRQTFGRAVLCSQIKKGKENAHDWYIGFLKSHGLFETFKSECGKISTLPEDIYLDGFFTRSTEDFLKDYNKEKPFFLWLNYSVPHGPYDVPEKYHTFNPEDMPGATVVKNFNPPADLVEKTKYVNDEKIIRKHQAGFCANVSFMDHQVGKIIATLKEKGLYDNTMIVFFSDQGVMIGDHKRFHKGTLYRQITNPALIISWPARMKKGLVANDPVELTDLIRTSLELADASPDDLQKRAWSYSLLPVLYKGRNVKRKNAFGEIENYVMVTDGRYRLIQGKEISLLFNDETDPKNLINIAPNYPDVVKKLSVAIDKWFDLTGKPLPPKSY